jgi:hypothetical protein
MVCSRITHLAFALGWLLLVATLAATATHAAGPTMTTNTTIAASNTTATAKGTFEVKLAPLPVEGIAADAGLGRMAIDKLISGDLQATTQGQMLSLVSAVKGSAGYVAIERVSGVLNGRRGTFALQHSGTMNRGVPGLAISVVPDSGTGDLVGIAGQFKIEIIGGQHLYQFDYSLPAAH